MAVLWFREKKLKNDWKKGTNEIRRIISTIKNSQALPSCNSRVLLLLLPIPPFYLSIISIGVHCLSMSGLTVCARRIDKNLQRQAREPLECSQVLQRERNPRTVERLPARLSTGEKHKITIWIHNLQAYQKKLSVLKIPCCPPHPYHPHLTLASQHRHPCHPQVVKVSCNCLRLMEDMWGL